MSLSETGFLNDISVPYVEQVHIAIAQLRKKISKFGTNSDLRGGHIYLPTKRNANYVEVDTYLKQLKKIKKQILNIL